MLIGIGFVVNNIFEIDGLVGVIVFYKVFEKFGK